MTNVDVQAAPVDSDAPAIAGAAAAAPETRIDSAHAGPKEAPAPHLAQGPQRADEPAPLAAEALAFLAQVRGQATELAEHLRGRQAELDAREASLNARTAEVDKHSRASRLWLLERQQELLEEQPDAGQEPTASTLRRRERELVRRERELAAREAQWAEASERQKSEFEAELWRREAQWQSPSAQQAAERRRLEELAGKLRDREQSLVRGEALFAQQQAELEARARECDRRGAELEEREVAQRKTLAAERRGAEAEMARRKLALDQRADELDVRSAAVEQLRSDVARLHRESLEMRLATEELWAQLAGAMAPAALTQSLARLRAKLADDYKLSESELEARQQELARLAGKLTRQHDKLAARRRQVDDWAARRQAQIEEHSRRLAAREQELARLERRFHQRERDWQSERDGFQQEIRRLLRQLRTPEPAVV
jgi:hypothetical protein